jgi:hypothetical protein
VWHTGNLPHALDSAALAALATRTQVSPAGSLLTAVSCSVSSPVLFTADSRKSGASLSRVIVLSLPAIVIENLVWR